ncbi:MAG: phage tail tape measure protein, partial [Acidobacteriota bacterium]
MANLGDLVVRVSANVNQFEQSMGTVSQRLSAIDREATRSFSGFDKLADRLTGVGASLTAGITLPLGLATAGVLKFAGDFDGAIREVTSLTGNTTAQAFEELKGQVLGLSKSLGVDAVGSAKALYEVLSANIPADNALAFLETATRTAIAGVTSTKTAVDGLTTIINSYGLSAKDASAVSDAMFQAVNFGKVHFEELAASVGIAASSAKTMHISYDELLGTMAAITLQGRTSSEAFTEIQSAMKALLSPNKEMNKLIAETGFSSAQALIDAKGFAGALQSLNTAAHGNSQALTDAFGRIEGYNAMLHVTGPGADLVTKSLGMMNDKLGATARAQAEIEQGFPRFLERFKVQVEDAAIAAGDKLLPAVKGLLTQASPLVAMVSGTVDWFSKLPVPIQAAALGMVALTAAIGPVLLITGTLGSTFVNITAAVTTASGIITKFPAIMEGVSAAFALSGPLAIAFGAAIAGWAIYEAVTKIRALNDELNKTYDLQKRGVQASTTQGASISMLTGVIERYNGQIEISGKSEIKLPNFNDFAKAADPINSYIAALQEAAKKIPAFAKGNDDAAASLARLKAGGTIDLSGTIAGLSGVTAGSGKVTEATQALLKSQQDANAELKTAQQVYANVQKLAKEGAASQQDVAVALRNVQAAAAKAHPELTNTGVSTAALTDRQNALKKATEELTSGQSLYAKAMSMLVIPATKDMLTAGNDLVAAQHNLRVAEDALKDSLGKLSIAQSQGKTDTKALTAASMDADAAQKKVKESMEALSAANQELSRAEKQNKEALATIVDEMLGFQVAAQPVPEFLQRIGTSMAGISAPAYGARDAMHELGITSSADLKKLADSTHYAYEVIKAASSSTTGEIEAAWKKDTEAARDYA